MQSTKRYFAEFIAANGKPRYVGNGAMMPWAKEDAKLFTTKQEARAALAKVAPHHRAGTFEHIGTRTVTIAQPVALLALGLEG